MSRAESTARVVELLLAAGFQEAGCTRVERVRVPTMNAPVFGATGGEPRTFGDRQRLCLPGTDVYATVGPRTTYLYVVQGGKTTGLNHVSTSDTEEVLKQIQAVTQSHADG